MGRRAVSFHKVSKSSCALCPVARCKLRPAFSGRAGASETKTGRYTYRCDVAELILLPSQDLSQDASHDLAATGLGQIRHDIDGLGRSEGTDALAHLRDELLAQRVAGVAALLERDKGVDSLACELVVDTDDGSLTDGMMLKQSCLDLGRG